MRAPTWLITATLLAPTLALAAGCDDDPEADPDAGVATPEVDTGPPQLRCAALEDDPDRRFCDDFGGGAAMGWIPQAGTWEVIDGRYVGVGPMDVEGVECGASRMSASLREGSGAADLALHVRMASRTRADKVVVLRATDAANRIELNFRADPFGDLVVQELVDCEVVFHVEPGEIAVPHAMDAFLEVEVELVGDRLVVVADGETVLDRQIDFANDDEGRQGLAVIDRGATAFDDVYLMER